MTGRQLRQVLSLPPSPDGFARGPARLTIVRHHRVFAEGQSPTYAIGVRAATLEAQVATAVVRLRARGALTAQERHSSNTLRAMVHSTHDSGLGVAVVCEPGRPGPTAELLTAATHIAAPSEPVVALVPTRDAVPTAALGRAGADRVVVFDGIDSEDDTAAALARWVGAERPAVVLAPSTTWGREVAARVAARIGAGLTGDAVELERHDGALIAWKSAFGGSLVVAIHAHSSVQLATVRPGVFVAGERADTAPAVDVVTVHPLERMQVLARVHDDDVDDLARADVVIAVGRGVAPDDLEGLEPLRVHLGARFAATRKVTDAGWMPRARQLGITGRSNAPRLLVSIGAHGKFNHSVGFRNATTVLAINPDPKAPIFDQADIGIVAPWQSAVPLLLDALAAP